MANHTGGVDATALWWIFKGDVSFLAGAHILAQPLFGYIVTSCEGLLVPRGGSKEKKQ